ncbi:MAG TPA: leucyl/phenylalanyl-tRNA--protein transferase [Candidatus Methylacidiphilales bacterium]|jgi:leucyl/phenylalanyl-tRNA--protein transferase|nr:leucyl/phenylalanyl-tRNA--protein transferase [Candidatus Methylacidiphilales bacterium]
MNILRPDSLVFPNLQTANREGLLALGGDLSVPRLLLAYRSGIFPWTDEPLTWWSPDPRAIFELERFRPPDRLKSKLRNHPFRITIDHAFSSVIHACADPAPGRESTWISPRFIDAYIELHRAGHAHSVEVWQEGRLVGGVYGVAVAGFFAGESMFHRVSDASKIALCFLMEHLRARNFELFDTQVLSPLTARLGAIEIRRRDYLERLASALRNPARF